MINHVSLCKINFPQIYGEKLLNNVQVFLSLKSLVNFRKNFD